MKTVMQALFIVFITTAGASLWVMLDQSADINTAAIVVGTGVFIGMLRLLWEIV